MDEDGSTILSEEIIISFMQIISYFGGCNRSIREGEEIVNAGWVYAIGTPPPPSQYQILGYVVQASSMLAVPHEIKLNNILDEFSRWICICTCKAGEGRKCKHIAACLIHIYRNPCLQRISCTDTKQKWGKSGKRLFSKKYSSVGAVDMCHCPKKVFIKNDEVAEDKVQEYTLKILQMARNCELRKLLDGVRRPIVPQQSAIIPDDEFLRNLIQHDGLLRYVPYMDTFLTPNNRIHFSKIQKTVTEAVEICSSTRTQTSASWLVERKLRITGSISYALYTYSSNTNPNWQKKLTSIYDGSFKGNEATRYGQYAEKLSKEVLSKHQLIFEMGLIISPDLPFLAYSPDAISYDGDQWKLVEIKSPVKGREMEARSLIPHLKYLYCDTSYKLHKRHPYYGQIQLGLAITNLNSCDLIIFSSKNNSYEKIEVPKDSSFIETYIHKLCDIYFLNVMPYLFK